MELLNKVLIKENTTKEIILRSFLHISTLLLLLIFIICVLTLEGHILLVSLKVHVTLHHVEHEESMAVINEVSDQEAGTERAKHQEPAQRKPRCIPPYLQILLLSL